MNASGEFFPRSESDCCMSGRRRRLTSLMRNPPGSDSGMMPRLMSNSLRSSLVHFFDTVIRSDVVRGCPILHKRSISVLVPVPTFKAQRSLLPNVFLFGRHCLLSFGLSCRFMISPRPSCILFSLIYFLSVLWQLLRAVKSLVMGKKTFLDPAAGK